MEKQAPSVALNPPTKIGEILVAVAALERLHSAYPEMICIRAEDVKALTEPELDFESVSIEHEDLDWGQGEVGGTQKDGTAMGMAYDDEGRCCTDTLEVARQLNRIFRTFGAGWISKT